MLVAAVLVVCVLRLVQMQLMTDSSLQKEVERLKLQNSKTLKTARGRILDRNGEILAEDLPEFELVVGYELSCFADQRVTNAKLIRAKKKQYSHEETAELQEQIDSQKEYLKTILEKLALFGPAPAELNGKIEKINNYIWNMREHLAWKRNYPDYNDFAQAVPDANQRLLLAFDVDIAEMYENYHLLELMTQDDVFTAQLEFADVNGIGIQPQNRRVYPWCDAACQIIGWVRPQKDKQLFAKDPLFKYLEGELAGFNGVEYICETILRGRRGKEIYDIDKELIGRTETQLGADVQLGIDIKLQHQIQQYLAESKPNTKGGGTAVVVIDVAGGDILAMVSMPVFDLNRIRYDYGRIVADPNKPLCNRNIESHYPPGSVIKPLILIAGLESKKITPTEVISCPAKKAPKYWPSCWIYNEYRIGHDLKWTYNNARNAVRGSCNIYFSRLANRLEPRILQNWLFKFGYGKGLILKPEQTGINDLKRKFYQLDGYISSSVPKKRIQKFSDIPPLKKSDLRWFGIGQGNFRVTPLQVANAMAAIARRGLYKKPRLIISPNDSNNESMSLGISFETIEVVYEGMRAVVYENGGTANREFVPMLDYFDLTGVRIYGKTGSTQAPKNAWFGGFAKDKKGRSIAIAVVVEGGEHGSKDAAPLARDIIDMCIQAGYIGRAIEYIQ